MMQAANHVIPEQTRNASAAANASPAVELGAAVGKSAATEAGEGDAPSRRNSVRPFVLVRC